MHRDSWDTDKRLFKASDGLLFFGVPNLGTRHKQLHTIVGSRPPQKLIDDLVVDKDSEPSPLLQQLESKFFDCCEAQKTRVNTFYELRLSPTVQVNSG